MHPKRRQHRQLQHGRNHPDLGQRRGSGRPGAELDRGPKLTGWRGGADTLIGGSSHDNLTGLAGADVMRGMDGNDRLFAHDGGNDKSIDCDGGDFPGATDQADLDLEPSDPDSRVLGCETVTRH